MRFKYYNDLIELAGKKVLIYLNEADLVLWNALPAGDRSRFVSNALKLRGQPVASVDSGRLVNLDMADRLGLYRLENKDGVYWVKAKHPDAKLFESEAASQCPRCRVYGLDFITVIESAWSKYRGYCPECVKEAQERSEANDIKKGETFF